MLYGGIRFWKSSTTCPSCLPRTWFILIISQFEKMALKYCKHINFHEFCQGNIFVGISFHDFKKVWRYIVLKINFVGTIFHGFLSTAKIAKINTFTVIPHKVHFSVLIVEW